jgi:hypothetical protein
MPGRGGVSRASRSLPLRLLLAAALTALIPSLVHALVPEPPYLIRGAVTVNGAARAWGTVTLRLAGSPEAIATFPLGTLPGAANGYVLAVPMDALEPQAPHTARPGGAAQVYLDGAAAAAVTIGERGGAQNVDLTLDLPDAIVLIRGPTGTPATTASMGAVYLDVEAADTQGHTLSYGWSAACPGADDGSFDNAHLRTPVWTAPASGATPLSCTLTVAIVDGEGLSIEPAAAVTVLPTVAPDPVPQILAHPDPSLCGEQMSFDGSPSFHSNPDRSIVLYEWDFDYDGTSFDIQATGATAAHGYGARGTPVTVALRVTDDGVPPRSAIETRQVHPGGLNRPPTAVAGGPYALSSGRSLALNGSASVDPDAFICGDAIAAWEWDLDGDGAYDDATGPQPQVSWPLVEALLCGGTCAHGATYPVVLRVTDSRGAAAVAFGEVAVSLLIFADDFANGNARGDRDWLVRSGAWTVLGASAAKRYYASSPTAGGLSVAKTALLQSLVTGMLETRIALTKSYVSYANGAVVFGYKDNTHYRYVRLQYYRSAWKLVLGQLGRIGTVGSGTKASKTLKGLRIGRWYRLWVDVYEDGLVNVFFNTRTATPTLSYRFPAAAPGRTGYQALKARAYFDNFAAWDRGVLP